MHGAGRVNEILDNLFSPKHNQSLSQLVSLSLIYWEELIVLRQSSGVVPENKCCKISQNLQKTLAMETFLKLQVYSLKRTLFLVSFCYFCENFHNGDSTRYL